LLQGKVALNLRGVTIADLSNKSWIHLKTLHWPTARTT